MASFSHHPIHKIFTILDTANSDTFRSIYYYGVCSMMYEAFEIANAIATGYFDIHDKRKME